MRLANLVWCDLKNGLIKNCLFYVVTLMLFVFYSAALSFMKIFKVSASGGLVSELTFGDYAINVFWGMKEYVYDPRDPFTYPALWMLTILLVAYFSISFPYKDLMGVGKHLLVASGSRYLWWFSKCIWVLLSILVFFLTAAAALVLWTLLTGGTLSFDISPGLPALLGVDEFLLKPWPWDVRAFFVSMILIITSLCLAQLLVSLILRPLFSFMLIVSVLLMSAYFQSPFLLGNFTMGARSAVFLTSGIDPYQGIVVGLCLCIGVTVTGALVFKQMDILNREKLI